MSSTTLNGTLVRAVGVAALGGSLLGFDTAVISGATQSLVAEFHLTSGQLGLTVSAALWGTVIGAIAAGPMGRRYGGKTSLLILAACYLVSALGAALSNGWALFLLTRFIGGLGMGGSSVIAPVYIAEVSPASWRGRLVGAFQINIIGGILVAYFSNYLIGRFSLGADEWRWQFGVAAAPAALFLSMLLRNPPSARWLAMRGRIEEAIEVLRQLGSTSPSTELAEIVAASSEESEPGANRLIQRRYRRPILLALVLAMFNQLVGINAVLYYLNDIFSMAGFDRTSQNLQAVAVGGVMLVSTLGALAVIDNYGRRTLLLIGSVGLGICLLGITVVLNTHGYERWLLLLIAGFVASFSFSQGAVIWVYLSEIFPARVRAQGQSLGSSTHWIMNALVSGSFPLIAAHSHSGPFIFFLLMVVLQFVIVLTFFPETSGISLEAMHERLAS